MRRSSGVILSQYGGNKVGANFPKSSENDNEKPSI